VSGLIGVDLRFCDFFFFLVGLMTKVENKKKN
jgi:hypothetical protein